MEKNSQITVRFEGSTNEIKTDKVSYLPAPSMYNENFEYYKNIDGNFILVKLTEEEFNKKEEQYYIQQEVHLLSGPIEIFATVDCLREVDGTVRPSYLEMYGEINTPSEYVKNNSEEDEEYTDAEIGEFSLQKYIKITKNDRISLESPYISNLVFDYYHKNNESVAPIVYVETVMPLDKNNQTNRGAYFRFAGSYVDPETTHTEILWEEVLLGTHSHSNPEMLERFCKLNYSDLNSEGIISLNKNGDIYLTKLENLPGNEENGLPQLPEEYTKKLEELSKYNDLYEPSYSEWHHLDADLELLEDTYDWKNSDDPVSGNCKALYRNLLKKENKLYLTSKFDLSENKDKGIGWLTLDIFSVNFDSSVYDENHINIIDYPNDSRYSLLKLILPWKNSEKDQFFIFDDGNVLLEKDYEIINKNENNLILLLRKDTLNKVDEIGRNDNIRPLTVLVVHEPKIDIYGLKMSMYDALESGKISLLEINNYLAKLYVENEFTNRPLIPRLYLSTDEYGKIVWDNKFVPNQTFYAKTIEINSENLVIENKMVKVKFEKANYEIKENGEGDFPILIIDGVFSDLQPLDISGKDAYFEIPVEKYDFDFDERKLSTKITLILVKNSVRDISNKIAEEYISKEDAVKILSHGKINLKDYVKNSKLLEYSKIGHVHSEYAAKIHNHDERYAMFHHTHPEILIALSNFTGANKEDIDRWFDELDGKQKTLIENIVNSTGIREEILEDGSSSYYFDDTSIRISDDVFNNLVDLLSEHRMTIPDRTLKSALDGIIELFNLDEVLDNQVKLENAIIVNNPVGAVKVGDVFEKGESLQSVLRKIFNPYISIEYIREKLTPTIENISVKWLNSDFVEVIPDKLPYPKDYNLYLELDFSKLKQEIVISGIREVLKTIPLGVSLNTILLNEYSNKDGVFIYEIPDDLVEIGEGSENLIKFSWMSDFVKGELTDVIFDNYGTTYGTLNPNRNYLEFKDIKVMVNFPDFVWLVSETSDPDYNVDEGIQKDVFDVHITEESGKFIKLYIESSIHNFKIMECDSHTNITNVFKKYDEELEIFGTYYNLYYFECFEDADFKLLLQIGDCKICN